MNITISWLTFLYQSILYSFVRLSLEVMSTQDEVATSLISLYQLFVALRYLTKEEINWPPHDPTPFNVSKVCGA